ncbi:LAQU0S20e00584g1_1 [Lachancea quebecensis]|uniref:LAQU0S20e00584g1_1 n=1 Tax=Lachancea quebecensis TaxID=1654605 RepID=A0A0P1KZF3_9SACH|nr:LAQU0S20e00584g1_1 [Lachancea quebecensis]
MPDITPLFRKYVTVFSEDEKRNIDTAAQNNKQPSKKYMVNDTFVKECSELLRHILELQKVVISLKPQYESESDLSEREKDDFDTEVRLLIQQYFGKLKFLGKYEEKRQQIIKDRFLTNSDSELLSLFRPRDEQLELFHLTNNRHRDGVLQSLNMLLSSIFSSISKMQQQRLSRKKELDSIDFNAQLYAPIHNIVGSVSQSPPIETTQEEVEQYKQTVSQLSQQQLQILETEHEELLNLKTQELESAENLSRTMVQISSLQNEIATHLQSQTQNIFTLLDNHDDVELDIQKGNRQLKKAQRRSGKSAKLIVYLSVLFGVLILFLDFIN